MSGRCPRKRRNARSRGPERPPARRAAARPRRRGRRFTRDRAVARSRRARDDRREGRLVTAPLVDCHLHLDASLTAGRPRFNESGTLIEGIQVWGELKPSLTEQDVFERAQRDRPLVGRAGNALHPRARGRLRRERGDGARAAARCATSSPTSCTIQVTAFPQDGIYAREGDERAARERDPARRRLRRRHPPLRADRGARPSRGAPRLRARQAATTADRHPLRRDRRPRARATSR